jgi:hypothetical protein
MAAFWAEMGVAYSEINKLPCLLILKRINYAVPLHIG